MTETATTTEEHLATAAEVCATYDAGAPVQAIAFGKTPPVACIEQLLADGEFYEAIQFMARWLTKREAVWWGALCLWQSRRPQMSAPADETMQALVQWVLEPNEDRRRRVQMLAKRLKKSEPMETLATALFYSGGSLSHPGLPEVEPEADATASFVAKLLRGVALRIPDYRRNEAYQQFLRVGMEIVAGDSHWEKE